MGTALVTGATSGIGLELVWQLAAAQHDLVLVARGRERLEVLAEELRQKAGVQAEVLVADLSTAQGRDAVAARLRRGLTAAQWAAGGRDDAAGSGGGASSPGAGGSREDADAAAGPGAGSAPEAVAGVRQEADGQGLSAGRGAAGRQPVAERCVDLLVNNAGFAVGQRFVGGDLAQEERALAVMVQAVLELTHAALPGMVERGHGAVLNISSATALTAMGTYAAHKAWVRTFTEGLASELAGTGVTCTEVNPGLTRSEFHSRAGMAEDAWPDLAWLRAEDVAAAALAAVRRGQVICTPSLRYQAVNAGLRLAPRWLVRRVAGHASVRTQY